MGGVPVSDNFRSFAEETGRKLHLEVEPGTFLLANAGALVSTVQDVCTTGADGHTFLKLDSVVTEGSGAYCSGMSARNYNSFPEAAEVMVGRDGEIHVIRARQPLEQIWANEVPVDVQNL